MKLSKSKLALAKVINENGGWVDDSVYAANDECGIICGYLSKPIRRKTTSYHWIGSQRETWIRGIKTPQWHQCVLSREEYYQAYPMTDDDGWIEWCGGECPVGDFDEVQVKYKVDDGSGMEGCEAQELHWHHEDADFDIVAYRLHKPEAKPEFCESVMRSIPEPEEKPTIEQLAHDYRNAKDYALRLQKDAGEAAVKAESFAVEIRKKILELQELIG